MGRRRSGSLPVMRRRASTGHSRVHVNGKTYWLGPYGSPEAQLGYDARVAAFPIAAKALQPTVLGRTPQR